MITPAAILGEPTGEEAALEEEGVLGCFSLLSDTGDKGGVDALPLLKEDDLCIFISFPIEEICVRIKGKDEVQSV